MEVLLVTAFLLVAALLAAAVAAPLAIPVRSRRGRWAKRGYVGCLVAVPVAFLLFTDFHPVDYFLGARYPIPIDVPGYRVAAVQRLGSDFYECYLEVTAPNGATTRIMLDPDGDKWWITPLRSEGGRVYVILDGDAPADSSYVEPATGMIYSRINDGPRRVTDLDFSRGWN